MRGKGEGKKGNERGKRNLLWSKSVVRNKSERFPLGGS